MENERNKGSEIALILTCQQALCLGIWLQASRRTLHPVVRGYTA